MLTIYVWFAFSCCEGIAASIVPHPLHYIQCYRCYFVPITLISSFDLISSLLLICIIIVYFRRLLFLIIIIAIDVAVINAVVDIVPWGTIQWGILITCSVCILLMFCTWYVLDYSPESSDPDSLSWSSITDSVFIGTISSQIEYF